MLGATPPRRISRSSTRKETDSLSSCSTTRESANLPPKVIRWSVAMEPAISRDMARETTGGYWYDYPAVGPTVDFMTDAKPSTRLAYDDAATPQEMSADCRALGRDISCGVAA